ncbi:hypothetical protein AX15_005194 [Amanita polypyramis BW_CC]|nr:hypothetical protein AX15_005194 [Amanita polypyramis BW_CC]
MSQPTSPASPNAHFSTSQPRSFISLSSPRSYLDPPQGMSYADFIRSWSDSHVARWLADIKCSVYAPAFKANDIRGDIILDLDQVSLIEMGISTIGDRLRILNAIKTLRQRVQEATFQNFQDRLESLPSSKRRLDAGRPAPLQLQPSPGRGNLPDIIRDPQPEPIRTLPQPVRPLPQQPGNVSSQVQITVSVTPASAHPPRPTLPPPPPPPRSQPPHPPSGTRTPSRNNNNDRRTPTPSDPASPYSTHPVSYPSFQDLRTVGKPSPLSFRNYLNPSTHSTHGRNGSLQVPSQVLSVSNKLPPRPSTTPTSIHPYANVQPTLQIPAGPQGLSPIAESFIGPYTLTPGSPSPPSQSYGSVRVGNSPSHTNAPSLGDLRWKLVKFILPDEEGSFTIDVTSCANGIEVLEKVLKKLGKGSRNTDTDGHAEYIQGEGGLTIDGWGVYLETGDDTPGEPLTEAELMSICHAPPDHPSREPGLFLRRTSRTRRQEDRSTPTSPSQGKFLGAANSTNTTSKGTKRASTTSVLSGLGVRDPEHALEPPSPTSGASLNGRLSPAAQSINTRRPSKLRNFFGQRPPSELITNHLSEFFPFTEKKVLQRTARNSMMLRSGARRDSSASLIPPLPSRFSSSTQGSGATISNSPRASIVSVAPLQSEPLTDRKSKAEEIPRMSLSTDDGHSALLDGGDEAPKSMPSEPQLLPPIPFPSESLSDSLQNYTSGPSQRPSRPASRAMSIASRRMSYMTELRSKRDRSDTASMVTVDEITAEVESRRATNNVSIESSVRGSDTEDGWTRVDTDEGHESEDVNEEFDEEEDEVTLHNDVPVDAVVTTKANKWIKGALIGAGSFGKVYLGMDAATGFLMAVKQVELPTGSGPNEERKKSMLSALEREIELLKNLQHENIVQYLYSSIDEDHLNIFLEYVPGGSVTALLRSYGAFEEPLVKNFVRQILDGLNYLHERDIMHRDIKGGNILVDNKGGIKISDFGISKKVDTNLLGNRMHRPSLQGSVFWMAPEVVKQRGHTKKADIWSVGCLVVEMLTGEHPWAQLTQMQAIFKIGSSERPAIPSDISPEAQDFLQHTFELDYEARPPAAELLLHPWITKQPAKPGMP